MSRLFGWRGRVMVAAIAIHSGGGIANAQDPSQPSSSASLADMKARVPVGGTLHVTSATHGTMKGTLVDVTNDAVTLRIGGTLHDVAAGQIRRIQWQRRDSLLNGALIGAAIGAVPGIYWTIVDPNECTGFCPEEYGLIAVGALVGGLVDHFIVSKLTVYVHREQKGVQVVMRF